MYFFQALNVVDDRRQTVKEIHIENLFHLLIFSVDFFFEGVYNMRQVKTVGKSDSILFYFIKEVRS
jgi:hypothetical protein